MPERPTQVGAPTLAAHAGRDNTAIVCGCGPSLLNLPTPQRHTTIGVNDVGRLFDPTYLVVVNPRSQFTGDRFRYVEQSNAQALYTQLELGPVRPPVRRFRLGPYGGTEPRDSSVLPYTQNSPYVAVCLAVTLGARRIGLIGVDFTEHHFFAATGRHNLAGQLHVIDAQYGRLAAALAQRGIELVNLSARSRLASLRKVGLDWLDAAGAPATDEAVPRRRIVSYATTPVAGVPSILARCIASQTGHDARCVWATDGYGNGVRFQGDVQWQQDPAQALGLLEAADVVIVHNGKVDPAHRRLIDSKPVVTLAHNYAWNVDARFVERGQVGLVVGQYQATLPEFAGWGVVPNPVPIWEPEHMPGDKGDTVCIAYTPSGPHERYPAGHRLYWHGKGFQTTMRLLEALARRRGVHIETTAGGQVSHAEALAMKRRAHIVIDECVTGSYHRNSLEGLAAGAVVVNGVGLLPAVQAALQACAPTSHASPFVFSSLESLERTLEDLVDRGAAALAASGRESRLWMERHWQFQAQWSRFWQVALLHRRPEVAAPRAAVAVTPAAMARAASSAAPRGEGVSVVLPHRGTDRLEHLAAALRGLAQARAVSQIIVVESGEQAVAAELAARAGARHVFVADGGPFQRGHLLNVGAAQARQELVMWQDNDLLFDPGFVAAARDELAARQLDVLLPYHRLRYLDPQDSARVMAGELRPDAAAAAKELRGGSDVSGGMALLRRDFFEREGGVPDGFRGWGGEDNAWSHKATLLGRYAMTQNTMQVVHHLHHADSGAHAGTPLRHSDYDANLALLRRHRAVRSAAAYRRQFPAGPRERGTEPVSGGSGPRDAGAPTLRNVFACLVHESLECVIDLVRNLHHFDPESRIVLYDGSRGGHLLDPRLPWASWGAQLHPTPRPMAWGSLHGFALDCLRLLRAGPDYDTLTIVDSDQLLLRPGYSRFLAERIGPLAGLGVLSGRPQLQGRDSPIAPVRTAWQEAEHWRSWLAGFPGGAERWVHWSFWPSTVITRAAGEAIVDLFDRDTQFAALLARSQLWATEEILFPTLAALLGFRVERNPCDDRWLQFRQTYRPADLERALAAPSAFWMHPVPRSYGDPLRGGVRKAGQQYAAELALLPAAGPHPKANPWLAVLRTMRSIEGWLEDEEAELLALAAEEVLLRPGRDRRLLEIGSYCGKATFVLASAARLAGPAAAGARVIAVDTFDGTIGALDTGIERKGDTRARFDAMLQAQGLGAWVDMRVGRANAMQFTEPVDLLLLDGLHDHASAALDFHAVASQLAADALVAVHDCAPYFPGVCSLVAEMVGGGQWRERARAGSLRLLERAPAEAPAAAARHAEAALDGEPR